MLLQGHLDDFFQKLGKYGDKVESNLACFTLQSPFMQAPRLKIPQGFGILMTVKNAKPVKHS